MPDLDDLAADLDSAIAELAAAAGVPANGARRSGRAGRRAPDQEPRLRRALPSRSAWPWRSPGWSRLMLVLSSRDDSQVGRRPRARRAAARPRREPRRAGAASARRRPPAARTGPTSSRATGAPLTDDQLIQALELGNVVILYDAAEPPAALLERCRKRSPGRSTPSSRPPARR